MDAISAVSSPQTNAPAVELEVEAAAAGVRPQDALFLALLNGFPQPAHGEGVLGSDVDRGVVRADGERADRNALEHTERARLEQHPVHERAGVALVAVAHDVFRVAGRGADGLPLEPGREPRAASAPKPGVVDLLDDLLGLFFFEASSQGVEAAAADVFVEADGVDAAGVLDGDVLLRPDELGDGRVADVDGVAGHRLPRLVGQQFFENT